MKCGSFADNGADVFINISDDGWYGDSGAPGQHLNMARMRAIENERWLLRSTNTGITAAIDPFGRVVVSAPRNVRAYMQAPFAYVTEKTFYTEHGDWFPDRLCHNFLAGIDCSSASGCAGHRAAARLVRTEKGPWHGRRIRTGVRRAEQESPRAEGVSLTRLACEASWRK